MTYVEQFRGYIADVPRLVFKRCDGKKFYFDELTAATVTPTINTLEINAGWSLFPVAILPGQSTFEMNITSGKFDAEIFSMANATEYSENATYAMPTAERHEVDADHQITLLETPIADSVYINGLEETTEQTVTTGKFKVDTATKKITFSSDDTINEEVEVIYDYNKIVQEAVIDNKSSAIGEASLIYPVYAGSDTCPEPGKSDILGYWVIKVFRARITTQPGMDNSYKTAGTFNFVLSALDAKRNDEGAYSTAYFRK